MEQEIINIQIIISVGMLLVLMCSLIYSLVVIRDCKKIIKSMKRTSRKYMKEVVSK
jgi:hypothetical protein